MVGSHVEVSPQPSSLWFSPWTSRSILLQISTSRNVQGTFIIVDREMIKAESSRLIDVGNHPSTFTKSLNGMSHKYGPCRQRSRKALAQDEIPDSLCTGGM